MNDSELNAKVVDEMHLLELCKELGRSLVAYHDDSSNANWDAYSDATCELEDACMEYAKENL